MSRKISLWQIEIDYLLQEAIKKGWVLLSGGRWAIRNRKSKLLLLKKIHNQKGKCGICGEYFYKTPLKQITLDHIIPRSKGGLNGYENRQAAHAYCDKRKSNKIGIWT